MYEKVTTGQCWKAMGKNLIKTGWADTNMCTSDCPNTRSRWVAKGIRHWSQARLVQRNVTSGGSEARHLGGCVKHPEGDSALGD